MDEILSYFPKLTPLQIAQLTQLMSLYREWNEKINVISRKDIDNLYLHHVLHSLSIAKVTNFKPFTQFLDIGTGGGFPGIPLAIVLPECRFHLIDGTGKKIKVCNEIIQALGLPNVKAEHLRAEQLHQKTFDFVLSRGTLPLSDLYHFAQRLVLNNKDESYNKIGNGLLLLKGGDLTEELATVKRKAKIYPIYNYFPETYFEEKYLIHLRV